MRLAIRTLQRVAIFGLGVLSVWLIVDDFQLVDRKLPWVLALSVTYAVLERILSSRASFAWA